MVPVGKHKPWFVLIVVLLLGQRVEAWPLWALGAGVELGILAPGPQVIPGVAMPGAAAVKRAVPHQGLLDANMADFSVVSSLALSPHWQLTSSFVLPLKKEYAIRLAEGSQFESVDFVGLGVVYAEHRMGLRVGLRWLPFSAIDAAVNLRVTPMLGLSGGLLFLPKMSLGVAKVEQEQGWIHIDGSPRTGYDMVDDRGDEQWRGWLYPSFSAGLVLELAGMQLSLCYRLSVFFSPRYPHKPLPLVQKEIVQGYVFSMPLVYSSSSLAFTVRFFFGHPSWKVLRQRLRPPPKPYGDRIG